MAEDSQQQVPTGLEDQSRRTGVTGDVRVTALAFPLSEAMALSGTDASQVSGEGNCDTKEKIQDLALKT